LANHSSYGTTSNTSDLLARLKGFIIGVCGWTLWDDQMVQGQPYFVAYSAGESGKEDIFLQFIVASANVVSVRGALYWDQTSHTAVKPVYSASTAMTTSDTAPFNYWMFGNLDRVFIVTRLGANYYGHYSGLLKRFWSDKIAVTQGSAGVGSDVTVPVNDASILSPGKPYVIKDNTNIARVLITTTDVSSNPNTITIAALLTGYSAGAKIGEDPQPVMIGQNNPPSCLMLNRHDGYTSQSGHTAYAREFSGYHTNRSDPDSRYGLVAMFPIFVTTETSGYDDLRGELIDVYSIGSSAGASEDVIDLGTSTYKMFCLSSGGGTWIAVRE